MKGTSCEKENLLLGALRSGAWTPEIRAHAQECPVCSDLALVDEFLQNEAGLTAPIALPEPSLVWWKAQIAIKKRAMGRATRPVQAAQVMACFVSAIALIWLVIAYSAAPSWMIDFSYRTRHAVVGVNPAASVGIVGCLLCLFVGSVYLAWSEK